MVKVIIGKKGTGKTKILVDMVNTAAESATGNVVCIEKGTKLTYDVKHSVRLIDISAYGVSGYAGVLGFVAGILAANYDIKEIFIDGIIKMGGADQKSCFPVGAMHMQDICLCRRYSSAAALDSFTKAAILST